MLASVLIRAQDYTCTRTEFKSARRLTGDASQGFGGQEFVSSQNFMPEHIVSLRARSRWSTRRRFSWTR